MTDQEQNLSEKERQLQAAKRKLAQKKKEKKAQAQAQQVSSDSSKLPDTLQPQQASDEKDTSQTSGAVVQSIAKDTKIQETESEPTKVTKGSTKGNIESIPISERIDNLCAEFKKTCASLLANEHATDVDILRLRKLVQAIDNPSGLIETLNNVSLNDSNYSIPTGDNSNLTQSIEDARIDLTLLKNPHGLAAPFCV